MDTHPNETHRTLEPEHHALSKPVARLLRASEAGSAKAQYELAMRYETGDGITQDHVRCVHWYMRAAAQGHGAAINNLADKYEHGLGVAQDLDKAAALYRRAAAMDVPAAWYSLGVMAAQGKGMQQDLVEAQQWLKLAARCDFLDARQKLAQVEHTMKLDAGKKALAEARSLRGQVLYEAARALYEPKVPESVPLAFELFLCAAARGHSQAQFEVGFRFHRGLGVKADAELAMAWYQRSAVQGNPGAIEQLAELYAKGELECPNESHAFAFCRRAAQAGNIFAIYRLARMYEEGRGTKANPAKALHWMRQAARFGIEDSVKRAAALSAIVAATSVTTESAATPPRARSWKFWKGWKLMLRGALLNPTR